MTVRINLARTDRSKLPKFIRLMYWLGFSCEKTPYGYLVFKPLTHPAK